MSSAETKPKERGLGKPCAGKPPARFDEGEGSVPGDRLAALSTLQPELFTDDCPQPAAAASEPVFWTETTRPDVQSHPPAAAAAAADLAADTARADPTAGDVPADASEPA